MELPEYRAANETSSLGERLGTLHRQLLADVPQVDRIGCALYDPDDDLLKTFVHSTLSGEGNHSGLISPVPVVTTHQKAMRTRMVAELIRSFFRGCNPWL